MGAYRKLLFHNEVVSGEGANCINDITNVLYVSSNVSAKSAISANQAELETLSNLDFENHSSNTNRKLAIFYLPAKVQLS